MKKNFIIYTFIIFILTSFSIFAEREVSYENLGYYEENELVYVIDEKEPFTGIGKDYYEDKSLRLVAPYLNGKLEGIVKEYYPSGKLKAEENYIDGQVNGKVITYYENGNIRYEQNYKDGKLEGLTKAYYESGKLNLELNYINDLLDGLSKEYYENGQLSAQENYKEGKRNGELVNYDEKGNVTLRLIYKDDEIDEVIESTGEEVLTTENKFEKYLDYVIFGTILALIAYFIIFKLTVFPKTSNLSDEQREKILKILIQHDENKKELLSASKFCGIGTGYSKVGSLAVDSEKVYIKAKIFSLFRIPFPKVFGYILSYDEDQILASYSNQTFKEIKKEIKEVKDTISYI